MLTDNKHIGKAERLLQKGKLDAALEEYLLAWKEEPDNDVLVQTVADLYQRLNRPRDSYQCYAYLFDKYAEKNERLKAIEIFRKLQRLGGVEPRRMLRCAQLVESERPDDALEYYQRALDAAAGQDPDVTLQCLQGLAGLQATSVEVQARIAATALKLGKSSLAASAYRRVGQMRMAEGKHAEAIEALEEALRISGASPSAQLELARACARAGRFGRVLSLLTETGIPSDDPEVLTLVGQAYQAEQQLERAEAVYWELLQSNSEAIRPLLDIAAEYIRRGNVRRALESLDKLEKYLFTSRQSSVLLSFAEKLSQMDSVPIPVLEYLTRLFDRLHLDSPLSKALNQLFDLYLAAGQFAEASDVLERLIAVDVYAPECFAKLQQLEGKVDSSFWQELAGRLGKASTSTSDILSDAPETGDSLTASEEETESAPAESPSGNSALRDLILQTEIFLQYKLEDKAKERLQRIAKLFPGEEEKNEELKQLYQRAKFKPQPAAGSGLGLAAEPQDLRSQFARVSEISRNLARQGTVKGVLSTAVNDIGRLLQVSRCVAGLLTPNRPPTLALEYIAPGTTPSDPLLLGRLLMSLQQIAVSQGSPLVVENVSKAPALAPLQNSLEILKIQSLLAILLRDGEQPTGLLILEQCGSSRVWKSNDLATLETLAEQVVLSVSNVRLRNLMRTLAVSEQSGLLRRESYIPCLLSEAERSRTQKQPLSAVLLHLDAARQAASVEEALRELSNTLISHLRQNDIAIRYGPQALALILPGTTGKEAVAVFEKMRKLLLGAPLPGAAESSPRLIAAIAEAVPFREMESADIITELINRLEDALEAAQQSGAPAKLAEPPALRVMPSAERQP